MDYNSVFKEKLGKLLFLEIDKEGFKRNVGIPSYVSFVNKDLYLPISSEYITTNIQNEIKIKNLPIFYFVEGMFLAIGADKELRYNDDYEVVVSNDLKDVFKLNKYIDEIKVNGNKLKVVGYYTSEDNINSYFVSNNTIKYRLIEDNKSVVFYSGDKDKLISKFEDNNIKLKDVYESDKNNYISEQKESMISAIIVALIMLVISLIEVILMTRSSFLSRIKEVGIYRAIGVKKSDIYKMFIGESFAISTLASLPGVLFMSYSLNVLSTISYIGSNYMMNIYVLVLCIVIVYVFNMVVGLIPVFNTMKKTPAQILARHDLD